MVFGLVPDQGKMLREMTRVVKPGGIIAISTHGPTHYAELSDAVFNAIPKKYMVGHRILYWPSNKKRMQKFFRSAGLSGIYTKQIVWNEIFKNSDELYEFIASSTANFWASFIPDKDIELILKKIRKFFADNNIHQITLDVMYVYGRKNL